MDARLTNRVEIIDKTDDADKCCESDDDFELLFEKRRKVKNPRYKRCKYENHEYEYDSDRVGCWFSFSFILIEMWQIDNTESSPESTYSTQENPCDTS